MMYTKDLHQRHIMLPSIPSSSSSTRVSSSSVSSAALTSPDHEHRADQEKKAKKQQQKQTPRYDRVLLPWLTGVVDYGILVTNLLIITQGTRSLRETRGTWGLIVGTLLANVLATGVYVVREELHIWLLGPERISPYKLRHTETPETRSSSSKTKKASSAAPHPYNIPTLLKVLVSSGMVTILLMRYGIVWDEDVEFTYAGWKRIFLPFYGLLLVRDLCFMAPFHTLMHSTNSSNPVVKWFRTVHYKHHEVGKSAQSLHAYHIDEVDLFIENVGAPIVWSCVQYLWGRRDHVGLSFNTIVLFTLHDIGLHSVNPYSILYFNPLLDYLLYPNVCHQLHHTPKYQTTYICFTPYHHILSPHLKRIDMQRYDANFKTKFFT